MGKRLKEWYLIYAIQRFGFWKGLHRYWTYHLSPMVWYMWAADKYTKWKLRDRRKKLGSVVLNYEARWDEIGSDGRLLSLDGEWQHTNSDLSIGLGFSPEILIGEGLYSGNKVQLQLIETSYLQFRDVLADIIENGIFRPVAMKRGFYELDKWDKPRWIYPKVSFSRLALRDSGDVYDMLYNLYSKGSIPVSIILEFLEIDPEDAKRKLEEDLYGVNDAKFNELLSNIYNSVGQVVMERSDVVKRVIKGLQLDEVDEEPEQGPEGSGQG
jgi:hypothetical protein